METVSNNSTGIVSVFFLENICPIQSFLDVLIQLLFVQSALSASISLPFCLNGVAIVRCDLISLKLSELRLKNALSRDNGRTQHSEGKIVVFCLQCSKYTFISLGEASRKSSLMLLSGGFAFSQHNRRQWKSFEFCKTS